MVKVRDKLLQRYEECGVKFPFSLEQICDKFKKCIGECKNISMTEDGYRN